MGGSVSKTSLRAALLLSLAACYLHADSAKASYVGPESCALCHKNIAATEEQSVMAKTWGSRASSALRPDFDARVREGNAPGFDFRIWRQDDGLAYSAQVPKGQKLTFPVDIVMGGERHGLGFLIKVGELEGFALPRPALIQARYFWSFKQNALVLAPGLSADLPHSYESALGLVLSPSFETQCLTCHGQPNTLGAGKNGGVHCESCHGPGSAHLAAVGKGQPGDSIINPRKLSADESIQICAQCHSGFGRHLDPAPDDLLIANQVQALRSSECFIQSGKSFSCTACHDPHQDSRGGNELATRACLGCHATQVTPHAAICPVNAIAGCVACHMPAIDVGLLHLVDHQIRVHPEQHVAPRTHDSGLESQRRPIREYLRVIRNDDREKLLEAKRQIEEGTSFYDVARAVSKDATAAIGGFWGEKEVARLEPALATAVAKLQYGELSEIVSAGGQCYLIQRMPRDFRWQAEQIQHEAETLLSRGQAAEAIDKSQQALKVYPHYRQALLFIGTTLAQAGNLQRAADVLSITSRLYPTDAVSLFSLGAVLGALNRHQEEIDAYRRALALEPDFVAGYAKLGAALDAAGDGASSVATIRQGLLIDPLSADLYHDLSLALAHRGEEKEAKLYASLAALLDQQYAASP